MNWVTVDMGTTDLGDKRLDARLIKVITCLSQQPQASIPVACQGWHETKAAYRLFSHPNVTADKLLQPHIASTLKRIKAYPVVLLIQDTTTLNYSGQYQRYRST
jgi:hypothetical protein